MNSTEMVTTILDQKFEVDTSDEACGAFGFKYGDEVMPRGLSEKAVVVGVAPIPNNLSAGDCIDAGEDVLWTRVGTNQHVSFFPDPRENLQKVG